MTQNCIAYEVPQDMGCGCQIIGQTNQHLDTAESDVQCEVFNTLESIHCQLIVYVHLLIVYRFLGNTLWFLDAYCSGHLLIYGARAIFIGNKVQ